MAFEIIKLTYLRLPIFIGQKARLRGGCRGRFISVEQNLKIKTKCVFPKFISGKGGAST